MHVVIEFGACVTSSFGHIHVGVIGELGLPSDDVHPLSQPQGRSGDYFVGGEINPQHDLVAAVSAGGYPQCILALSIVYGWLGCGEGSRFCLDQAWGLFRELVGRQCVVRGAQSA
ncbi:Uncharacterised protein [Mycobacteroides abscessus subsp. massiliense]|nr:Uncharacterised protein [Mycobacteroides abscessus subsp. massiliense]SKO12252.1 Uncharacterised protein [Mycobacteroides abscessus subsp. massiliense]